MRRLDPIRRSTVVPGSRLSSHVARARAVAGRFTRILLLATVLSTPAVPALSASIRVDPGYTEPLGATVALPGIVPSGELLNGSGPMIAAKPSEPGRAKEAASRPGAYCPIGGCQSPPPSRLSDTAAFGAVIFGGAWFSRRRVPSNH